MNPYDYKCKDDSVLLPFFKKRVFSVLHHGIPYGVPANYLTLVSIIAIWSCFLHFFRLQTIDITDIIIAFSAITIYLIFDHFDGLQAKRTNTSSPLGEILDHYSDVFNGSLIIYIFFRILQLELDWIFYFTIWGNLAAFSITYLEQSIKKELYFGKIGSLEGIILIQVIILSCMTSQGKNFWTEYSVLKIEIHFFLLFIFFLGVLYTIISSLKRLESLPKYFIHFIINGLILIFLCIFCKINWHFAFFVINVYSADFILKSMSSNLSDSKLPKPDSIIYCLYLFILFGVFIEHQLNYYFLFYGTLIAIKILWNLYQIFSKLKNHWIWWNR